MTGDKNKNAIWALLLSLLAIITTFQQNYHNDQLSCMVTPNEMVGLYCRDQPLNDPPPFLRGLSLILGSSQRRQFTWCWDLPSTRIFLTLRQEDPSTYKEPQEDPSRGDKFYCKTLTMHIGRSGGPVSITIKLLKSRTQKPPALYRRKVTENKPGIPKKVIELGKSIKFYLDNTIPRPTTELELLLPPLAILERGLFLQRGPGPEEGELKWEIPARPK